MKEINVSPNTPTSETNNRRRLLIAAAAIVVVIGVAGIALANNNDDDPPSPPEAVATLGATTTVAPTTTIATDTVSFVVEDTGIPVTLNAPAEWTVADGFSAYKSEEGAATVGVLFDNIANIYADGCQSVLVDPPVGPTVDDLVEAWANLPDFAASAAVDVTVDGYAGKQFELTIPDYTVSECRQGKYRLWDAADTSGGDQPPGYWAQAPGQHLRMWVLDVDGTRLVIGAVSSPSTSAQDQAALENALASIQIG